MNSAYLHLLLNHVPILGTFFGVCLLLFGIAIKQPVIQRVAFAFFVFAALVSIPVMLSGEGAEDIVEKIPAVTENVVEEHEEAAKIAYISTLALGALSLIYLLLDVYRKKSYTAFRTIILLIGIAAFVLMARTGLSGGKIIHQETGTTNTAAPVQNGVNHEHEED